MQFFIHHRLLSFKAGMLCADDALAKPDGSVNAQHLPCSLFAVFLSAFKLGDGETQALKTDPHLHRCRGRQRSGLHRGAAAARGSAEPSSSGWSGCFRAPFRIKTLLLPPPPPILPAIPLHKFKLFHYRSSEVFRERLQNVFTYKFGSSDKTQCSEFVICS